MQKRYFIVIRHAEKLSDFERDPGLSEEGLARSEKLTEILQKVPLDLVITSRFRRTQETATSVCRAKGLETQILSTDPQAIAAYAISKTKQCALIIGHVDTVARIIDELCSQKINHPHYNDYDNIWLLVEEEPHFGEVQRFSFQDSLNVFQKAFQKLN